MRAFHLSGIGSVLVCSAFVGCSGGAGSSNGGGGESTGQLSAAVTLGSPKQDVAAIHFSVHKAGGTCSDSALDHADVALQASGLPPNLANGAAGADHPFADRLFVLDVGSYLICADPITAQGSPSKSCGEAQQNVNVQAGKTNEILLVSKCTGATSGAADVITTLDTPPEITSLELDPSKFITTCDKAKLSVQAVDPDQDPVTFFWKVDSAPAGAHPVLDSSGATVTFSTDVAGDYELTVTATDSFGLSTSLQFPMHVTQSTDPQCGGGATVDLLPLSTDPSLGAFGFCRTKPGTSGMFLDIQNAGSGAAPATSTRLTFLGSQGKTVMNIPTPAIPAGASIEFGPIAFPPDCFIPSCGFSIEADVDNVSGDVDTSNNDAIGECLG